MSDKRDDKDWESISFIKRSEQRRKVLEALDQPSMPKELVEATDIRQSHVSRALKQLKEKSMVEILNPEAKRGRLYQRTDKGNKILEEIDQKNSSATTKVRDNEPEYSVVAEGAVLKEKTRDSDHEELNKKVKEVLEKWKNGELEAEEVMEKYEKIREEMDKAEE